MIDVIVSIANGCDAKLWRLEHHNNDSEWCRETITEMRIESAMFDVLCRAVCIAKRLHCVGIVSVLAIQDHAYPYIFTCP